jgi:hypothetical protein
MLNSKHEILNPKVAQIAERSSSSSHISSFDFPDSSLRLKGDGRGKI